MEEGMNVIFKILFVIVVGIALLAVIYLLKDTLYEKVDMVKDVFSNLF